MDNNLLIIVLLLIAGKNVDNESSNSNTLLNFVSNMEVDNGYTIEKLNMVKKVGPYFPENYIPVINKSISFADKFTKISEAVDFIKEEDKSYILEHIPVNNNKDRISKVISTIQRESSKSEISKTGTIIDLIINMDKYKKMFGILSSVMSNPDSLNDPAQLLNLAAPLIGGDNPESNAKFQEMAKMLEIIQLINSPKSKS